MTNHRTIDAIVSPLSVPAATAEHALATAREKALDSNTARMLNLAAACHEIERWVGRIIWPASSGGRVCTTTIEVDDPGELVSLCPRFPLVAGVDVDDDSVRRWDDNSEAYVDAEYSLRPGARIRLRAAGVYELVVELTPQPEVDPIAVEAAARLWAYRELKRPQAGTDALVTGDGSLSSAIYRSGASGLLRSLKSNAQT